MNSEIPFDVPAPGGSDLTRLPYTPSFVDHSLGDQKCLPHSNKCISQK